MKDILPEIEKRRAYRALNSDIVPEDVIERVVTAGTYAASCANSQPWRLLVQRSGDLLEKVKEHISDRNYWAAPSQFIVAVCTRYDLDCQRDSGRDYAYFDTGMAVGNMLIQGVKEGLYSHPIAGFDPAGAKEVLEIPEDVTLLILLVFGYPGDPFTLNEKHLASEKSERSRKPLDEIAAFGAWPGAW